MVCVSLPSNKHSNLKIVNTLRMLSSEVLSIRQAEKLYHWKNCKHFVLQLSHELCDIQLFFDVKIVVYNTTVFACYTGLRINYETNSENNDEEKMKIWNEKMKKKFEIVNDKMTDKLQFWIEKTNCIMIDRDVKMMEISV